MYFSDFIELQTKKSPELPAEILRGIANCVAPLKHYYFESA